MAPEHEARTRVLYDHESEEPGRRRRAVADWGVGEDIFDRMPSRRFTRTERRSAHSGTIVISRDDVGPGEEPWSEPEPRFERADPEPEPRRVVAEPEPERRRERAVESWLDVAPGTRRFEPEPDLAPAEPPARLVAASDRPEPAPVRTVVVPSPADEPRERRTVMISGHPGGLPVARPARPPKTAMERVGTRPDRIVAYAVALGFLLVLIAILTTGQ